MAKKSNSLSEHELKVKLIQEASKSLQDYMKLLDQTRELEGNINHITKKRNDIYDSFISDLADIRAYEEGFLNLTADQIRLLKAKVAVTKDELDTLDEILKVSNKQLSIHKAAVKEVKLMAVTWKDVGRQVGALGKKLVLQTGYLLDQQKAVKETELSMGILSNQANGFRNNIYKTSLTSTQLNINTADLAKIQGTYSDNIGRSVQLSEEQLLAMSELAKGTVMGAEGAAEFAAQMENFNISAKGSAEFIDDMLKTSHEMGVSSSKVIKNVQKNIGLLQKYNFKGGVKGLTKMAALATKFKFEMQSIADFAENLITPEGAVEAAAKLQVLGGAWAKLGDPFELMYRSRNDLTGLTNDIINATKETARFDKVTGEVSIDPMELHRLREIANATGLEFDSLAKSAKEAAKFTQIESSMSSIFNQEDKEFISGLANWNDEKKEFEVTMQTKDGTVTESVNSLRKITPEIVKSQRDYQQTLKKNAEQAMTFAERWEGLENMFRSILLPGFEAFANALEHSIGDFHKWAVEEGLVDTLVSWGKWAGELAGTLVKWIANNPIKAGIAALIGSAAVWIARGAQLGIGFNMTAGSGLTGGGGKLGGKLGGAGGKLFGGMTKGGGMGSNLGKGLKSGGAIGGGVLSAGFSGYDEWSENSENGMSGGENAGRTALRGGLAGGGAWGGAALGASIGTMVFPGVGTAIGGLLGGVIGGLAGDTVGDEGGDLIFGKKQNQLNDFIARDGESPVPFSKNDTVVGAKKGGPIDTLLNRSIPGNNDTSFDTKSILSSNIGKGLTGKAIEDSKPVIASNNKVSVDFNKPLKIEGKLELLSNGTVAEIDLDDPILMRNLSKVIQEELSKAIGGGKLSSNPVVVS